MYLITPTMCGGRSMAAWVWSRPGGSRSWRRRCQVLTQPRATQRYILQRDLERESLVERIVALATRCGGYGLNKRVLVGL